MYERLSIQNFRGVRSLEMDELRPINLIVGRNNCGKTTVLEALFLLDGATNPLLTLKIAEQRGQRMGGGIPDPMWRPLFFGMQTGCTPCVAGRFVGEPEDRRLTIEAHQPARVSVKVPDRDETSSEATTQPAGAAIEAVRFRYSQPGSGDVVTDVRLDADLDITSEGRRPPPRGATSTFVSSRGFHSGPLMAQRFSEIRKRKEQAGVLQGLRLVDERIQGVEVLSEAGTPALYLDVGLDALVPLAASGDGVVRLCALLVEMHAVSGGSLLVDELDNGLHHSLMPQVWRVLREMSAHYHVQVFATSHNDELIDAALEAFEDDYSQLGLFRIDARGDQHRAVRYDEEALAALRETRFEVRG